MFRLTIEGPQVATWRSSRHGAAHTTMRVYKWGDKTGYFLPASAKWESAWVAEQRASVDHGSNWLLESVTPLKCEAPPATVDDVWSEEVIAQGNIIAGNLLTIVGNGKTIQEFADRMGVKLSSALVPPQQPAVAPPGTPSTASADLPPPPAPLDLKPFPPRPLRELPQSSRGLSTHPGSRGPRMEERHLPVGARPYAPRPAHTGPRPYEPRAGQAPTFRGQIHRPSGPRPPTPARGGGDPRHYGLRRTDPSPRAQVCLVVEE
jgi:hypothetical protein